MPLLCLQVLRALTAQDAAAEVHGTDNTTMPMLVMALAMLTALNPIQPPRRPTSATQENATADPVVTGSPATKQHNASTLSAQQGHHSNADLHNQHPSIQSQHMASEDSSHNTLQPYVSDISKHQRTEQQDSGQTSRTTLSDASQSTDSNQQHFSVMDLPVDHLLHQLHADVPEQLAQLSQQYPKHPPYKGYRCDLVALLANLCFRQKAVQQKVQQLGCVELILSQCQVSFASLSFFPFEVPFFLFT